MVLVFVIGSILPEDQKQSAQFIYCKLKQNNKSCILKELQF